MLERHLEARCVTYAKRNGCWALKLWPTVTGLPDRLLLAPGGRVRFVEFKTPTGKLSKRQQIVIGILRKLGFDVDVVRSFFCFLEVMQILLDKQSV